MKRRGGSRKSSYAKVAKRLSKKRGKKRATKNKTATKRKGNSGLKVAAKEWKKLSKSERNSLNWTHFAAAYMCK